MAQTKIAISDPVAIQHLATNCPPCIDGSDLVVAEANLYSGNLSIGYPHIDQTSTAPISYNGLEHFTNVTTLIIGRGVEIIEAFPSSLESIQMNDGGISTFPAFPNTLKSIFVANATVDCFPEFPASLETIYFQWLTVEACFPTLPQGTTLDVFESWIPCVPSSGTFTNSTLPNCTPAELAECSQVSCSGSEDNNDIVGPECGSIIGSATYNLNPNLVTPAVTNVNWWPGSGALQIQHSAVFAESNVTFPSYYTGGQICAGVSYNQAPWHEVICRDIPLCPSDNSGGNNGGDVVSVDVTPNPSWYDFTLQTNIEIFNITLTPPFGNIHFLRGHMTAGSSYSFGSNLTAGIYVLHYYDQQGQSNTITIEKK